MFFPRRQALFFVAAFTAVLTCFTVSSTAQITINIPNFPGFKKPKATPTPEPQISTVDTPSSGTSNSSESSGDNPADAPASKGCSGGFYSVWNEDIQKTIDDAKSFTPGRDYFVHDFNDDENKYLKMALSTGQRQDYEKNWSEDETKKCVNDRLDELAVAAAKTIGGYKPVGYTLGTPAEKNILKSGVSDLNQAAVFNVGIKSPNWIISKDEYGLPRHRRRFGSIWAKYPGDKYCKIIYVNLFQDYSGGGTYNASEAQFISWEYAGCPAGK